MEENRDMFDYYDELPIEVQAILDKYSEMDNNYTNCDKLIDELVSLGFEKESCNDKRFYKTI